MGTDEGLKKVLGTKEEEEEDSKKALIIPKGKLW